MTKKDYKDMTSQLREGIAKALQLADKNIKSFAWAKTAFIYTALFLAGFIIGGPVFDLLLMPEKTRRAYERIGSLEARVEVLENEKSSLRTDYDKKIQELTQKHTLELNEQQARINSLVADYNKLIDGLRSSQSANEELVACIEKLNAESKKTEYSLLAEGYNLLKEKYSELEARANVLQTKAGDSDKIIAEIRKDYALLKKEKETFESQLADTNWGYATLEKEKQELAAKQEEMRQALNQYEQSNAKLQKRFAEVNDTLNTLKTSVETIETQKKELELQNKALEEKMHEKDEHIKGLEKSLEERTKVDFGKDETKVDSKESKPDLKPLEHARELLERLQKRLGPTEEKSEKSSYYESRSYYESDWFTDALLLGSEPELPLHGFNFFCSARKGENYPEIDGIIQLVLHGEEEAGDFSISLSAKRKTELYRRKNSVDMRIIEEQLLLSAGYDFHLGEEIRLNFDISMSTLRKIYNDPDEVFNVRHITGISPSFNIGFQAKNIGLRLYAGIEGALTSDVKTRVPNRVDYDEHDREISTFSLIQDISSHVHIGLSYKKLWETIRQATTMPADWVARVRNEYTTLQLALTDLTDKEIPLTLLLIPLRNIILECTYKEPNDELFMQTEPRFEYKLKFMNAGREGSKREYYGIELGWDDPEKDGVGFYGGIFWAFDW